MTTGINRESDGRFNGVQMRPLPVILSSPEHQRMASLGHVAVGMAAARVYNRGRLPRWALVAAWSALSLLPDLDVIGFGLGVQYADPWGHRGATHSLTLSIVLGVAVGVVAALSKRPSGRIAVFAAAVLVSHALLDTMTDGGLGCALLWPFDLTRYFAPWRPIPVAPIGLYMFSVYGAIVVAVELVLFSPVLLFALRSTPMKPVAIGSFAALWLAGVWLLTSSDPHRESVVGFVLREDTAFAQGFSEEAFRTVNAGASEQDVRQRLGEPHGEGWFYPPKAEPSLRAADTAASSLPLECLALRFENRRVRMARDEDACRTAGIDIGTSIDAVRRLLGPPRDACWQYSWSPSHHFHRLRMVCFYQGRVEEVIRRWVLDVEP
jgi:inner membrane protein